MVTFNPLTIFGHQKEAALTKKRTKESNAALARFMLH
jgi:hypothetical protein